MAQPQQVYREVDIEQAEQDAFEAWGWVTLKVQRGAELLGIKVKITSVPQETIDDLRKKAPRPPARAVMADPANPDHAALGVVTRQKLILPDYSDSEYIARKDAYDISFRNEIVGRGVASKLTLKDGTVAETPEQKYKALEERGISGFHFTDIAQAILNLTQWTEEERTNFLSASSVPTKDR